MVCVFLQTHFFSFNLITSNLEFVFFIPSIVEIVMFEAKIEVTCTFGRFSVRTIGVRCITSLSGSAVSWPLIRSRWLSSGSFNGSCCAIYCIRSRLGFCTCSSCRVNLTVCVNTGATCTSRSVFACTKCIRSCWSLSASYSLLGHSSFNVGSHKC